MAKVPLPERGQPLDVTYIYQLAETINDIATQVSFATYNYTTIDTASAGEQRVKTSQAKVVGKIIPVYTKAQVNAGQQKDFQTFLGNDFKFAPIVSATPVNQGGDAGNNVIVTITSVTTSTVSGFIRFNSSGEVSINVHLIAIGIPN
jgi:hypothetical protein